MCGRFLEPGMPMSEAEYERERSRSGSDPDGRGRDRATHAPRRGWDANHERDETGNTTTRAPLEGGYGSSTEQIQKPRLEDGFTFRRKF